MDLSSGAAWTSKGDGRVGLDLRLEPYMEPVGLLPFGTCRAEWYEKVHGLLLLLRRRTLLPLVLQPMEDGADASVTCIRGV